MFKYSLTVIIVCLLAFVLSNESGSRNRKPKIFSFNSDNDDVQVALDFSLPLLKIPLKKTFDAIAATGYPGISSSKININPTTLILGGLIIGFTSIFGPLVTKVFDWHHYDRSSRNNDDSNYKTFFLTEQLLANSRACPQRFACWTGRGSKEDTEAMQTWEKIMSNKLLATMLNTTALKEATLKGEKGHNCESYAPCPIEERSLPRILKNFAILTNYK